MFKECFYLFIYLVQVCLQSVTSSCPSSFMFLFNDSTGSQGNCLSTGNGTFVAGSFLIIYMNSFIDALSIFTLSHKTEIILNGHFTLLF